MHSTILHTLLGHLVELTGERDQIELEKLLAKTLLDLVTLENIDHSKSSITIYRAINIKKQIFAVISSGADAQNIEIPTSLKQHLGDCFTSGEHHSYISEQQIFTNFYPLKNTVNNTIAVVVTTSATEEKWPIKIEQRYK